MILSLFGVFFLSCLVGVPVGISLGLACVATVFIGAPVSLKYISQGMVVALDSFPLMAAPLFILAGELMSRGGISQRLLRLAHLMLGSYHGGLGLVAIASCIFFAGISGTGSADAAAIGVIMIPEMLRGGYPKGFSGSMIAAAGAIGPIIPPSVTMVVYCVTTNQSITDTFLAGVGPGILMGVALLVYTFFISRRRGYRGEDKTYTRKEVFAIVWDAKWAIMVPVIIMGGIYGGIFTPTEAAAVAVIYGYIAGLFLYKELTFKELPEVILSSALITSVVLVIIGTSIGFGRLMTLEQIPQQITAFISSISTNKFAILAMINILLLVVGTFMETLAAITILAPILLPLVISVGVSPVHFGVIMVVNLCIGFVTPPLGANLFVITQIADIPYGTLCRSIMPWLVIMIMVLFAITYIEVIPMGLVWLFRG
jgi:C4-dicarboxylate transporter DctM subunit